MTLALGSVLLSLLNLASAALIAEHRRAGWLVALVAQIPWVLYDVWTRQVGFLLLTLVYVPVYLRGWRRERPLARPAVSQASGSAAAGAAHLVVNDAVLHPTALASLVKASRGTCRTSHPQPQREDSHVPAWV